MGFFPERNGYIFGRIMPKFWEDKVEEMFYNHSRHTVGNKCGTYKNGIPKRDEKSHIMLKPSLKEKFYFRYNH